MSMMRTHFEFDSQNESSKLHAILTELQSRRPGAQRQEVDEAVVARVKAVEQEAIGPAGQAALRSAQGEEIERLALIDPLTELYNVKTFFKEVRDELKRCHRYWRPVSVGMASIDDFDQLINQFGHLTGDAILKITANVIRAVVRETDIAARYAGHTFAVIFPEQTAAQAAVALERFRQRVGTQAVSHNWQNMKVTVSVGVASYPLHAREYEPLIARADQSMQLATQRGGDRVCVY